MPTNLVERPTALERAEAQGLIEGLTQREREVVRAMADGLSAAETATAMAISRRTVDIHRTNIFQKLGVNSCLEVMQLVVASRMAMLLAIMDWTTLLR